MDARHRAKTGAQKPKIHVGKLPAHAEKPKNHAAKLPAHMVREFFHVVLQKTHAQKPAAHVVLRRNHMEKQKDQKEAPSATTLAPRRRPRGRKARTAFPLGGWGL